MKFLASVVAAFNREACLPEWYTEGETCPYGTVHGLWGATYTWPKDGASAVHYIAAFYSLTPFFFAVGFPLLFIWTRGTREILGIIFFWLQHFVMSVLKLIFGQPRPVGSCLTSCGMPSGHSLDALAYFTWFVLEVGFSRKTIPGNKCLYSGIAGLWLVPVGWSRTLFGDHSWAQVFAGWSVGVALGTLWYWLLQQRCTYWFLKMLKANVPLLTSNYPWDPFEEEEPWMVAGAGVPAEAGGAANSATGGPSAPGGRYNSFA